MTTIVINTERMELTIEVRDDAETRAREQRLLEIYRDLIKDMERADG